MGLFNKEWSFEEVVDNIENIRNKYTLAVNSFSEQNIKKRNDYVRRIKNEVYNLHFEEYKKDRIWNYMHYYDFLFVLKEIANRQKGK